MKQTEKLDSLIKKIIKEELDERDTMFISPKDPKKGEMRKKAATAGISVIEDDPTDPSSDKLKEKSEDTEVLENEVKASDIAGQVSEILDKLKTMAEAKEDPKRQKIAAKALKQMESAKAALEALTAHEMMLEEKEQAEEEQEAEKHVGKFKKALNKLVREPGAVDKIASKMDAKKMAELKKKMKSGELDEEKLARVMLQHSLKEGWIK
jgi:hypothetical protein